MSKYPSWDKLNPRQRKLALARYHEQRNGKAKPDPGSREVAPGLTVNQLKRATAAATRLKYGEAQRQLQGQAPKIGDWYQQYVSAIDQARQRTQADYQAAVQGVQGLQSGLDQAAAQQWAGQQQASSADAAQRGATVDPKLADIAHNASNVRNALTGSFGGMLLSQGVNQNDLLGNRGLTAGQQGIEALAANRQNLQGLLREKGAFKQQYRDQAISDASKAALNNALTAATLGVKAADVRKTNADTAKTKVETKKTALETAFFKKYGYYPGKQSPKDAAALKYFKAHGYWPRTGPAPKPKGTSGSGAKDPVSGPGSLTPAKEHEYISQIHTIADYFAHPPQITGADGKPHTMSSAEIVAMLKSGKNPLKKSIDPRVINVARSLFQNDGKGIGRWGVANAHELGIHVNGNFKVLGTPKAKKRPAVGGGVGGVVGGGV